MALLCTPLAFNEHSLDLKQETVKTVISTLQSTLKWTNAESLLEEEIPPFSPDPIVKASSSIRNKVKSLAVYGLRARSSPPCM